MSRGVWTLLLIYQPPPAWHSPIGAPWENQVFKLLWQARRLRANHIPRGRISWPFQACVAWSGARRIFLLLSEWLMLSCFDLDSFWSSLHIHMHRRCLCSLSSPQPPLSFLEERTGHTIGQPCIMQLVAAPELAPGIASFLKTTYSWRHFKLLGFTINQQFLERPFLKYVESICSLLCRQNPW